jgi:hypothetical protein
VTAARLARHAPSDAGRGRLAQVIATRGGVAPLCGGVITCLAAGQLQHGARAGLACLAGVGNQADRGDRGGSARRADSAPAETGRVKLPVFCPSFFLASGSVVTVVSASMRRKSTLRRLGATRGCARRRSQRLSTPPGVAMTRDPQGAAGNMRGPGDRRSLVSSYWIWCCATAVSSLRRRGGLARRRTHDQPT